MRWFVHVIARIAITATCTNSAAALDAPVEAGNYPSTNSLREHVMLDSSEFVNGFSKRDSTPDRALRSDFVNGNHARARWLELVDSNPPASPPADHPGGTRLSYFMEGFLLFGAMIHMPPAFPFEMPPINVGPAQPENVPAHERRASIALVSSQTIPERTESGYGNELEGTEGAGFHDSPSLDPARSSDRSWLFRPWSAVVNLWAYWDREREIKRAVVALAEYDDRTLRDMGIPHRSQIEHVVRYCREC